MSSDLENCPYCAAPLKEGVFGTNRLLSNTSVKAINVAFGDNRTHACGKCGARPLAEADDRLRSLMEERQQAFLKLSLKIPLASINSPPDWKFRTIGLVTAQTVTGTGMFSDVASAFIDLFGAQSKTYNSKIRHGEDLCRASLRAQSLAIGGNGVAGIDVDYAEVGGQRAMLMVCMTGTAVEILNVDDVCDSFASDIDKLQALRDTIADIELAQAGLTYT